MNKVLWCIGLVAVVLLVLLGLLIAQWQDELRLMYHVNMTLRPHELPTILIRQAFRLVTERELPQKADSLRAIFQGGREPRIFVSFETDSEGIRYIVETFTKPGVISKSLDVDSMSSP